MIETFENLQNDFLKRSKEISNTKLYLETELKEVDKFLNHRSHQTGRGGIMGFSQSTYKPQIQIIGKIYYYVKSAWSTFIVPFNEYYYNENEIPYKPIESMVGNTQEEVNETNKRIKPYHIQGIEFAKYSLWLEEQKELNKNKTQKKNTLSKNEQILMLSYMGFDFLNFENKLQLSKVLCLIIDKSEKNVRDALTHFDRDVKNEANLNSILTRFQHKDFANIREKIKEDLEKIT